MRVQFVHVFVFDPSTNMAANPPGLQWSMCEPFFCLFESICSKCTDPLHAVMISFRILTGLHILDTVVAVPSGSPQQTDLEFAIVFTYTMPVAF